ncbi:MAG: nicotinamide-nucleotide amidohydrolase family protein [Coriobacteriia bacterium]|nr:nicotinamide-nucleotide amidohydrolase family protein [Coriobacteriia bacterium]
MNHVRHGTHPEAAIIAVGTELVAGVRDDTNGAEVARALAACGYLPVRREVLPDDTEILAERIRQLIEEHELVVVTGGLGPTHDDVTRDAAAAALGIELEPDPAIAARLQLLVARYGVPDATRQIMRQAEILAAARVLAPRTGTAPGQLVATERGHLLLLPGPPHELRPMLREALKSLKGTKRAEPRVLGCVGVPESDAQVMAQTALSTHPGVGLTVLARVALVDVVLFDEGAGTEGLDRASADIAAALGDACYATDGASLAEVIIVSAADRGLTIALAESCTGGMVAAELTTVPGASAVLLGSVVTYADALKRDLLGVGEGILREHGAVSAETACAMATGVRSLTRANLALAVTGIAGPGGGTPEKPAGTLWFGVAASNGARATGHHFPGDRAIVRARATATALDLLRRAILWPETGSG